jgi:hypothetical protein
MPCFTHHVRTFYLNLHDEMPRRVVRLCGIVKLIEQLAGSEWKATIADIVMHVYV